MTLQEAYNSLDFGSINKGKPHEEDFNNFQNFANSLKEKKSNVN
jgi:hypothetical protein